MQHKRLYISADIEGVAGVVTQQQTTITGFEFQQAREWMTNEVLAVCEAAFESGVKEIVVSDSHGSGQNLLLNTFPRGVQIVRSWPRPLGMMEGIDHGKFDAAVLLGYHTGASDMRGVLAHTLSSRAFRDISFNGSSVSETIISAAIASHFCVPIIMASGDDAYTEHAQSVFKDVEVATVKWVCSATSARTLMPSESCQLIKRKTLLALKRIEYFSPYEITFPIRVDVDFSNSRVAELMAYLPMFERTTATNIQFEGKNMILISRILKFLSQCGGAM